MSSVATAASNGYAKVKLIVLLFASHTAHAFFRLSKILHFVRIFVLPWKFRYSFTFTHFLRQTAVGYGYVLSHDAQRTVRTDIRTPMPDLEISTVHKHCKKFPASGYIPRRDKSSPPKASIPPMFFTASLPFVIISSPSCF